MLVLTYLEISYVNFQSKKYFCKTLWYDLAPSNGISTPQPLRAAWVLFSPMVSGMAGGAKKHDVALI